MVYFFKGKLPLLYWWFASLLVLVCLSFWWLASFLVGLLLRFVLVSPLVGSPHTADLLFAGKLASPSGILLLC